MSWQPPQKLTKVSLPGPSGKSPCACCALAGIAAQSRAAIAIASGFFDMASPPGNTACKAGTICGVRGAPRLTRDRFHARAWHDLQPHVPSFAVIDQAALACARLRKATEHRGHRGFLRSPVLGRNEIDVEVAGKEGVELAAWNHAMCRLADGVVMRLVVAGNDAGRHLDRVEIFLARADDRQLGAFGELRAPALHGRDEPIRVHGHEHCAVCRARLDALLEMVDL